MRKFASKSNFNLMYVIIFIVAFLLFVFPNSFRGIKLPLILFVFIASLQSILKLPGKSIFILLISYLVTFVYIVVGMGKSKYPEEALSQTLVVYVFAPFLWLSILNYCLETFTINRVVRMFNFFMIVGCSTVFVSIWMFNAGMYSILEYIIDNPNMTHSDSGVVEVKLFVYGSLIFFFPAFIQLEDIFKKKLFYYIILLLCLITALISGRSALMISIIIGILFYLLQRFSYKKLLYIIIGTIVLIVASVVLEYFNVDVLNIFRELIEKVIGGGDKVRVEQTNALIDGINTHIFGAGHGVGVEYIRSDKFPWRYENVPVALIYKVSLLGFFIYSLPFLYVLYSYSKIKDKISYDHYMMSGLLSMIFATFTNPYLESFEFNIFYVLPFMYFLKRRSVLNK